MKEELYHIALDDYEHGVVIRSLNDKKTDLKKEGKSTDAVDDLMKMDELTKQVTLLGKHQDVYKRQLLNRCWDIWRICCLN